MYVQFIKYYIPLASRILLLYDTRAQSSCIIEMLKLRELQEVLLAHVKSAVIFKKVNSCKFLKKVKKTKQNKNKAKCLVMLQY